MNFRRWLIKQRDRCDRIGGLGLLVYFDRNFPSMASWREYKNYLYECGAAEEVIEAFEAAWGEFWDWKWGETFCRWRILRNTSRALKRLVQALRRYVRGMPTRKTHFQ